MSTRVLRKLQNNSKDLPDEPSDIENETDLPNGGARRKQLNVNSYELLSQLSYSESEVKEDDNETEANKSCEGGDIHECIKRKKKKKKRRTGKSITSERSSNDNADVDEVERSVREVNKILGEPTVRTSALGIMKSDKFQSDKKNILSVQQKHLNANNELKRIFGSKIIPSEHKKKHRSNRVHAKTIHLVSAKKNWPQYNKSGLSMNLVDSKDGIQYFAYEHSTRYRAVQMQFLQAVDSLVPKNVSDIFREHPYHIDSLLHLSDFVKLSEDYALSAEIVEGTLSFLQSAFHPSFNITSGRCRLDYKRQENRALYITLFKHMCNVGSRACYRTALELCKVILSLDPEGDPLAVKLALDFYALRSKEYAWLIELFEEWEPTMNLLQLPNFAFSIPIARFYLAKSNNGNHDLKEADGLLQDSLLMFPGMLMPLLEICGVQIDKRVSKHEFFGPQAQNKQPQALSSLINLYVHRSHHVWKESELLPWLEKNVHAVLDRVDNKDPLVKDYESKRSVRYQGAMPRSIARHIFLSDIKGVTVSALDGYTEAIDNFDPFPPLDSINIYQRSPKANRQQSGRALGMFFRSLMPNYNGNETAENANLDQQPEEDGARALAPEDQAGGDLRMSVVTLVRALRDLMSNIRPMDVPVEADVDDNDDSDEDDPVNYLT